jgi:hypothetical protein
MRAYDSPQRGQLAMGAVGCTVIVRPLSLRVTAVISHPSKDQAEMAGIKAQLRIKGNMIDGVWQYTSAVSMAHRAHSGSETVTKLQALLIVGAAFQREDAWAEWLERQLTDMANRLPADEPSKALFAHLQELKQMLKLTLGIHIRAEALASAANE